MRGILVNFGHRAPIVVLVLTGLLAVGGHLHILPNPIWMHE